MGRKINREGVWNYENFEAHCKLGSLKPNKETSGKRELFAVSGHKSELP